MKSYSNNSKRKPRVGDKVRYSGSSYYGPDGISKHKDYKVVQVFKFAKSFGVILNGEYGKTRLSATNFQLIEDGPCEVEINEDLTWMNIVDGNVVGTYKTEEDAKEAAAKLVQADIKTQVVIGQVMTVAKVEKPKVKFV